MISIDEQLLLFRSRVAIIDCGGLGGYVIEELARLGVGGVGGIVAIDPDIFEEHNLNRQLLSTTFNLGQAKAEAALERVKQINPAVTVAAIKDFFCIANGAELLHGVSVAVDALDSIASRLELAEICKIVLGKGELLRMRKLSIDLLDMEIHEIRYGAQVGNIA